jgi:hypothetical protein
VNTGDEQAIRQRLNTELGSLEIGPAPVIAVTRRGKAIRARRRTLAGGFAAVAVVAVLAGRLLTSGPAPAAVTLNPPRPGAPGGVFASGTAGGKPWRMTVRNIAAGPGARWCLPAVMFNGRDGNVLFKTGPGTPSFGNPALLPDIAGFPGVGAAFTQVAPGVTRVVATFPNGRHVTVHPVWVSACGQRFHLAGWVLPGPRGDGGAIATYTRSGFAESLDLTSYAPSARGVTSTSLFGQHVTAGVWLNLDKSRADIAASQATSPIGNGTVDGQRWHIRTGLGLYGQCYVAALRSAVGGDNGHGQFSECVPVAAPPHLTVLHRVPAPGAESQFTGYAGLVNPAAVRLVVTLTNGTVLTIRPVNVAGRAYVAFAVPPGCQVHLLAVQLGAKAIIQPGAPFGAKATVPPGAPPTRQVTG